MKRRGLQPMHDQHINVTPLVDVVMCLIIFFLVCGELVQGDMESVVIPQARNGNDLLDLHGRVVVNVMPVKEGKPPAIKVLGKPMDYPYELLSDSLRVAVSENREVRVIIRADKDVPYQFIAPVLKICVDEKAASVHFATQDEP